MATLRVLNLNVWDLPYSKDLSTRIHVLCRVLALNDRDPVAVGAMTKEEAEEYASTSASTTASAADTAADTADAAAGDSCLPQSPPPFFRGYDIIGLQEAFLEPHREALTLAARAGGLNYAHFFESGMGFPGYPTAGSPSGLLVISRYPIIQAAFHRYSINGKPQRLLHWDWHVGKGVGMARVSTPMGLVDAYISHFVASYAVTEGERDEYLSDRVAQAYECAEFIQLSRRAPLALLFCDLNSTPDTLPVQVLKRLAGLRDSYADANPPPPMFTSGPHTKNHHRPSSSSSDVSVRGGSVSSAYADWEVRGHTCNTNSYADGHSRRVDYILYSTAPPTALPDDPPAAVQALGLPAAPGGATAAALRRSGVTVGSLGIGSSGSSGIEGSSSNKSHTPAWGGRRDVTKGVSGNVSGGVSGHKLGNQLALRLGVSPAAAQLLDSALALPPVATSAPASTSATASTGAGGAAGAAAAAAAAAEAPSIPSLALALHEGSVFSPFSPLVPQNTPLTQSLSTSHPNTNVSTPCKGDEDEGERDLPSGLVSPGAFRLASQQVNNTPNHLNSAHSSSNSVPVRGLGVPVSVLPCASSGSRPNPFSLCWQPVASTVVLGAPIAPTSFPIDVQPAYLRYLRSRGNPAAGHSAEAGAGSGAEAGGECFLSDHCGISTTFVFPLPLPQGLSSPYIDRLCLSRYGHSAMHPPHMNDDDDDDDDSDAAAAAAAAATGAAAAAGTAGAADLPKRHRHRSRGSLISPHTSTTTTTTTTNTAGGGATRARALSRTHSRRWSVIPRPLDLDLSPLQDAVLRRALRTVEAGMVDAQLRQRKSRQRHVCELALIVVLGTLAYWGMVGMGAVLLLLPPLVIAATGEFYLHTMFANEEQSSLSSVWHSMALRLQLGPAVSLCNVRTLAQAAAAAATAAAGAGAGTGTAGAAGAGAAADDFSSDWQSSYSDNDDDDDDDYDDDNDDDGSDHDEFGVSECKGAASKGSPLPKGGVGKGESHTRRRRGRSSSSSSRSSNGSSGGNNGGESRSHYHHHRHHHHHHHHYGQGQGQGHGEGGEHASAGFFTRLLNIAKMFMGVGHFGAPRASQQNSTFSRTSGPVGAA